MSGAAALGKRLCDKRGCGNPATHLVTAPHRTKYYCEADASGYVSLVLMLTGRRLEIIALTPDWFTVDRQFDEGGSPT